MRTGRLRVGVAIAWLVAACGGGGAADTTAPPDTTGVPTTLATTTTSGAVTGLESVRSAVVRIVAEGSFVDPIEGTQLNAAGSGSGFIIDPSGLAVTNNHVVTGAALLDVYVEGASGPLNAQVLGVSECSDLAVIDIEGDGFRYLDWYQGEITAGMEIFAVGFPLGTDEYTVLDGVISKEDADGESTWASVDQVVEHSADTLPGNSGGPIVTVEGQVVAVNYAGDPAGQSFAIGRPEALEVIERLSQGEDVESIGINGQALLTEDLAGVWVASVESGSPADAVGVAPGDIVTRLEGLVLATDGTMSDYCDILRSNAPGDVLSIEVFRPSSGEVLQGRLNGEPLVVTTSFEEELEEDVPDDTTPTPGYAEYTTVTDDSGRITMDVPVEWAERNGSPWVEGEEELGPAISASPDLEGFNTTWDVPGVFFGASRVLAERQDPGSLLDGNSFADSCTLQGRFDYSDALYTGVYDYWVDCGGTSTSFVNLAAQPEDGSIMLLVQVQVVTDADLEALDTILATFVASGDL